MKIMIFGFVVAVPDQIYQRLNGVWQTGIAGPSGQSNITGISV